MEELEEELLVLLLLLLLLLAEAEGSGFLVGNSSAAILFLSGPQVGWGRRASAQVKLRSRHIRENRDCGGDAEGRGALTAATTVSQSVSQRKLPRQDVPLEHTLLTA